MKVGQEIHCPTCKRVMVRCVRSPEIGQTEWDECFENVDWNGGRGSLAECQYDRGVFARLSDGVYIDGIGYTWSGEP